MAPRSALAQAGASDSEDDLTTTIAAKGNCVPVKQPFSYAETSTRKSTKTKSAMPAKTATKRKAAPRQPRQALKDRTNLPSDDEDVDEDEDAKPKAKRTKTAPARKPRTTKPETLGVIPETQPDPVEDVEQSIEIDPEQTEIMQEPTPLQKQLQVPRARSASVQPVQPLLPRASARSTSAQPGYPRPRERSGSVSGTERERRGGDPELRRKLNEMTKKCEDINLKYQGLQEIGKVNADSNFEKLKRASDEKARDANALIASLKREIAELRKPCTSTSAELSVLQKQITTLTGANEALVAEHAATKEKLQTSQNDVKSLEAKLVAARQQLSNSITQERASSQVALRSSVNANATESQKEAKMKENLYSDLTGLIIRGVKRKEGEDEYDCLQTGRNGSKYIRVPCYKTILLMAIPALHFHLSIANDASIANPKTPTGLSYEEAEFAYEPHLDENRDRELIEILPDYLAEEICFPRNHAVKFYTKVVESMTKKIVVEE